jgi:hypothetical protein
MSMGEGDRDDSDRQILRRDMLMLAGLAVWLALQLPTAMMLGGLLKRRLHMQAGPPVLNAGF